MKGFGTGEENLEKICPLAIINHGKWRNLKENF
jgi:hypothetical protein